MKRAMTWGIGALALTGLSVPGFAADLGARPITKAPVAAPIPVYNWTSCYIGANGGGKWGRFSGDVTFSNGAGGFESLVFPNGTFFNNGNSNDFESAGMGGGQIGCQWQAGGWVFGIEGDFDGTGLRQTFVSPFGGTFFVPGDAVEFRNKWQASVRGRLGYAWDRWLVYATGGVAFADVRATFLPAGSLVAFEDSQTLTGGTVGGGVEYRFSKFGHETFDFSGFVLAPAALTGTTDLETHEVTARLNWHFNWFGPPVAARY